MILSSLHKNIKLSWQIHHSMDNHHFVIKVRFVISLFQKSVHLICLCSLWHLQNWIQYHQYVMYHIVHKYHDVVWYLLTNEVWVLHPGMMTPLFQIRYSRQCLTKQHLSHTTLNFIQIFNIFKIFFIDISTINDPPQELRIKIAQ